MPRKPILLVGDAILDVYHFGSPLRDSEGVSTFRAGEEKATWGGAALVARNLLELRQKVIFVSVFGNDVWREYEKRWTHRNLTKVCITHTDRSTIVKERFVSEGKKVLKWNRVPEGSIGRRTESEVVRAARRYLPHAACLVISDYRHGMITRGLARTLLVLARQAGVPVFVDSQVSQHASNHLWYAGADVCCLNEAEAKCVHADFVSEDAGALAEVARRLGTGYVVIKLGERGSAAYCAGEAVYTPGVAVAAVDTCGAGDAFLAALASRAFPPSAASLAFANQWAALSTTVLGAEPPKFSML